MRKWTTPTLEGSIECSADLSACEVYLTILQEGRSLTKLIEPYRDGGVWRFELPLTQEETGNLREGAKTEFQINVLDASGWRPASNIEVRYPGRNIERRKL
ncbi:MAG: hypothetical protein IJ111_02125 [Eggerthellaceae bacterium]|nr:hypothetical protein [Eggerthellaceae bacterium]